MRVFLSRMERIQAKDLFLPIRCYAQNYLTAYTDLECECDCTVFCKFPPPGNTPMPGVQMSLGAKSTDWSEARKQQERDIRCVSATNEFSPR